MTSLTALPLTALPAIRIWKHGKFHYLLRHRDGGAFTMFISGLMISMLSRAQ